MLTIEIKQTPDAAAKNVGLSKYNRSKMPGCRESFQPTFGDDGRWVTGVDELAKNIRAIPDPKMREAEQKRIKDIRERIESYTGLNLSATNEDFWGDYLVTAKDKLTLDMTNPKDELMYYVLIANKFVANSNDLNGPDMRHTKYYVSRSEEETSQKAESKKLRDKGRALLFQLSEHKPRMTLVAQYLLGTYIKDNMSSDTLYNYLSDYIDSSNDGNGIHLRKFLSMENKSIQDIQYQIMAQDAVKHRAVIKDAATGEYKRGGVSFGKSTEEVATFLSFPENILEFESIQEELAEKRIYA